jgi:thiamine biosynthesis lipoprotein
VGEDGWDSGEEALMGVQWQAWGTTVRVDVTRPSARRAAHGIVSRCVRRAERAADADRPGSLVQRLLRTEQAFRPVSPLLGALVATALHSAESSGGLVDPTVGTSTIPLRRALGRAGRPGLDAVFPVCSAVPLVRPRPAVGWTAVSWAERRVTLPAGSALDLTATAKARTARLAASRVAAELDVGVIVELGGDVATAGPAPAGGWRVAPLHLGSVAVELRQGMSLAVCRSAGIVDPATGRGVISCWEAIGVAAPDVVFAKTAAVAALVHGPGAEDYLDRQGLAAVLRPMAGEALRHTPSKPGDSVMGEDARHRLRAMP